MKAIILAGGQGTRLYPQTKVINKHLLSVYDKPMIYYPLSLAMLSGIKDIAIVCNEKDKKDFFDLLGHGLDLGIKISYKLQKKPEGLAQAFLLGEEFIGTSQVALILGDNLFYGAGFGKVLSFCY